MPFKEHSSWNNQRGWPQPPNLRASLNVPNVSKPLENSGLSSDIRKRSTSRNVKKLLSTRTLRRCIISKLIQIWSYSNASKWSERTSATVTRQTSLSSIHKFTDTPLGKEATESAPNLKRKRKSSEQGDTGSIQGTETRPPSITLGASRKRRPKSRRKRKLKQESRQNRLHPEIVQFVDLNAGGWDYSPLPGWMISRWAFCSGACRWCNNCGEGFNGWIWIWLSFSYQDVCFWCSRLMNIVVCMIEKPVNCLAKLLFFWMTQIGIRKIRQTQICIF